MASAGVFDKKRSFGQRANFHTVTIEKNGTVRKFTVRPWIFGCLAILAFAITTGYLGATGYLLFRDDLIGATMARQARLQSDYEARISTLRNELDRVTSRHLHDQQLVETKIDRLLRQQESIDIRQQQLSAAAERASSFGISPPMIAPSPRPRPDYDGDDTAFLDPFNTGTVRGSMSLAQATPAPDYASSFSPVLNPLTNNLQTIQASHFEAIGHMLGQVHAKHASLTNDLGKFGVKVPHLQKPEEAMGGPYIPINDPASFDSYLGLLHTSMDVLESSRKLIQSVPFQNPLPGYKISSGFGSRIDPFRGRLAMHSGIDFKAPRGTKIHATGAGKVVFSGRKGGYGKLVEIKHASGYVTRFGHLNRIHVKRGQRVVPGSIIGTVGSTGRSTGPHLHYEVRSSKKALNPGRFLKMGRKLARARS